MTRQYLGTITTWKNDKGFGFITPDQGGQQVFFHISDVLTNQGRPGEQMRVSFTVGYDQQRRPRATNIRLAQPRNALPLLPFMTAGAFLLGLSLFTFMLKLSPWVPLAYVLASLLTFAVYGSDKASAVDGRRRVPESTLHLFEFLGGWPGALVAQAYYRHKTRKASFQSGYLIAVVANLLVLILYGFVYHDR